MISLQRLLRTTLFKLICRVYAVNRSANVGAGQPVLVWNYPGCMAFLGLYAYRLVLSQSNFLRPGLYELVM